MTLTKYTSGMAEDGCCVKKKVGNDVYLLDKDSGKDKDIDKGACLDGCTYR